MEKSHEHSGKNIILGTVGMLLVLTAIGLLLVLTGGYNVAATDRHNPIIGWALDTTMRNHVRGAADNLTAPAEITPAMIAPGAGEYQSMCEHCHGGVGASRAEWAGTMRPIPPALAHATQAGASRRSTGLCDTA